MKVSHKNYCKITFVRTDSYVIKDKLYFVEITVYLESWFEKFKAKEWNKVFGGWIELPTNVSGR